MEGEGRSTQRLQRCLWSCSNVILQLGTRLERGPPPREAKYTVALQGVRGLRGSRVNGCGGVDVSLLT
jgi:hypothetical protein